MTTASAPPTIRRATERDAAALASLGCRTFSETFAADNTAEDLVQFLASTYGELIQREELASPHLAYFLAESAGEAVGFAMVRTGDVSPFVDDPTAIEVQRLYVDRAWHGTGLGRALMRECIRFAAAHDAGSLYLGVWERNEKALRFYAAQGFVPVGHQVFIVGSDPQTDIVMALRLPS